MARRRKSSTTTPNQGREYKIRLPEDIAQRIETKAKDEQRPQNRVIINELAAFPDLEKVRKLGEQVRGIEVIMARYGARIAWHDLSEELLTAVDAVLEARGGEQQAALDRLRVVRAGMLIHIRTAEKR